jgi:hypothetical protein
VNPKRPECDELTVGRRGRVEFGSLSTEKDSGGHAQSNPSNDQCDRKRNVGQLGNWVLHRRRLSPKAISTYASAQTGGGDFSMVVLRSETSGMVRTVVRAVQAIHHMGIAPT